MSDITRFARTPPELAWARAMVALTEAYPDEWHIMPVSQSVAFMLHHAHGQMDPIHTVRRFKGVLQEAGCDPDELARLSRKPMTDLHKIFAKPEPAIYTDAAMIELARDAVRQGVSRSSFGQCAEWAHDEAQKGDGA